MIYDFLKTCKTYDKSIYRIYGKGYFNATPCPACPAVGKFEMHGSYPRHAIYFDEKENKIVIICKQMQIQRVICTSCNTTHAILAGDIIPYKIITLFVFIFILKLFYVKKTPVLEIAKERDFSFQFIYSVIRAFQKHMKNIQQYFREVSPESIPNIFDPCGVLSLIKKPYTEFQSDYIEKNCKPCFMCKLFVRKIMPRFGVLTHKGNLHNI